MNGNCLIHDVIYKCSFPKNNNSNNKAMSISPTCQSRMETLQPYARHKNNTALSSYLWELIKKKREILKLTWSILKIVSGYTIISRQCLLCLNETVYTATYYNQEELLNKQPEYQNVVMRTNSFWPTIKQTINYQIVQFQYLHTIYIRNI